jgi:hypothetical protein
MAVVEIIVAYVIRKAHDPGRRRVGEIELLRVPSPHQAKDPR